MENSWLSWVSNVPFLFQEVSNVGISSKFGGREKNCDVILEGLEIPGRTMQKNPQHVSLIRLSLGSAWLRKMASRYHCILQCKAWFVDKVKAKVWRALRLDHKATYKAWISLIKPKMKRNTWKSMLFEKLGDGPKEMKIASRVYTFHAGLCHYILHNF